MCYYRFGSFRDFPKLTGNSQITGRREERNAPFSNVCLEEQAGGTMPRGQKDKPKGEQEHEMQSLRCRI